MNIFCSICLDPFTASCNASVTSCGHLFHSQCIARAFGNSRNCPQCRSVLTQNFNKVYLPFESQVEALRLYQAKHGHIRVSAKEDESLCNFIASVRQSVTRMENGQASTLSLTPDQMTALESVGLICRPKGDHTSISGIPSTSSSRFKRQRVEESLHEKMPVARSFPSSNENKDMEEIEGDVIPRWLMNDEEEIDSSDSMLAEISIKIEGGTY